MKLNELLIGIGMFVIAHILAFFQLNGQFIWKWFGKNEVLVAAFGFIISFFYIWGTKYTVNGFEGLLWPARFIGFGVGMIIYAIAVSYYFNEGISLKTAISLLLSIVLIAIQTLWKS
ncbi:MAG: hypothetical protein JSV76_07575 [Candidatus Bathyarchaeota archaeon]|nr:MAG: hypothetical protein JSV76_07575 [Candidatus Bathyarchaeota archaeon]